MTSNENPQPTPAPLRRGVNGVCSRSYCICERDGLGDQCVWLNPNDAELERRTGEPHISGWPLYSGLPPPAALSQPAPAQAVRLLDAGRPITDERAAFEAWAKSHGRLFIETQPATVACFGVLYKNPWTQEAWVGWQARASLAPSQAVPLTDEQIDRHSLPAGSCPPNSQVMLVSSIKRLLSITTGDTNANT